MLASNDTRFTDPLLGLPALHQLYTKDTTRLAHCEIRMALCLWDQHPLFILMLQINVKY